MGIENSDGEPRWGNEYHNAVAAKKIDAKLARERVIEAERASRRVDAHRGLEKAVSDLLEEHDDLSVDDKLAVAKIMAEFGKDAAQADQDLKDEWWQAGSDDPGRSPLTDTIGHGQALERAVEVAQEKLAKIASDLSAKRGY
jgi:hypothetical protein